MESEWIKGRWYVYLLRCCDESLYCGISNDLLARVDKHNSGLGAKYTRSRRPVCIVYAKRLRNHGSALKHEYRIKQLSKAEKEKLCLSLAMPRKPRARAVKNVRKS